MDDDNMEGWAYEQEIEHRQLEESKLLTEENKDE